MPLCSSIMQALQAVTVMHSNAVSAEKAAPYLCALQLKTPTSQKRFPIPALGNLILIQAR